MAKDPKLKARLKKAFEYAKKRKEASKEKTKRLRKKRAAKIQAISKIANLPFKEEYSNGYYIRKFSGSLNKEELYWHKDKEDREVEVLSGDWSFQYDDALPVRLSVGDKFLI